MTNIDSSDAALRSLTELAQQATQLPVPSEIHALGRNRVVAQARLLVLQVKHPVHARMWSLCGVAAAAAALVVVWFVARLRPITYEISGGYQFESGYVSVPLDRSSSVKFSDGSSINAQPGTRLRVEGAHHDGARVIVERGEIEAKIQHGRSTSWQFISGPFEVRVIGTAFTLGWEPSREEVNLTLQEGAVEVTSPLGRGPFVVRKGQHFQASLLNRSVTLNETSDQLAAAAPSAPNPQPPPSAQGPATAVDLPPQERPRVAQAVVATVAKPNPAPTESWSNWVSHGHFQDVVTAAESMGIDTCLSSCSLSDVRALADAARYTSRSSLAERALLTIRQRATGGSQRSAAAFLLGRLGESQGQLAAASTWYEVYLGEAPSGEFAADSLAGQMRTTARLKGNAAARPLAMQYLQRYPNGVHAATASKITNAQ